MAPTRRLIVEIAGDDRSLLRSFKSSSAGAKHFNADLEKSVRGAIVGSGAFRSLGRSVAFASSAFLGGVGIVAAFKSTIEAAGKAQAVLGQTKAAATAAGVSWGKYGEQIEGTTKALSAATGFKNTELLQSVQQFVRLTGDSTKALKLNALATNVARGRNISLDAASKLVTKAAIGQAGALRRLGINARQGASSTELLALLQQKFAGAAAAYSKTSAGALDRFHASVELLQEALGDKLLPIFTPLLNRAADWLSNTRNQEKVVKAVSGAVSALTAGFKAAYALAVPVGRAIDDVAQKLGGWKTTITLVIGAWAALKVAGVVTPQVIAVANAAAAGEVAAAWRAALVSTGWGALALAAGAAAAYVITHWTKVKNFFTIFWNQLVIDANTVALKIVEPFSHIPKLLGGGAFQTAKSVIQDNIYNAKLAQLHAKGLQVAADNAAKAAKKAKDTNGDFKSLLGTDASGAGAGAPIDFAKGLQAFVKNAVKAAQAKLKAAMAQVQALRDAFDKTLQGLDVKFARAGLTKSLQDDLKVTKQMEAAIRKELQWDTQNLDLQQKLVSVVAQRRDLEKQITQAAKDRAAAKQFRALGLTATGEDAVPGIKNLRKQLGQVDKAISGTFLDTKKTQSVISRIRKVLAGGLGAVGRDVRAKIKDILADLDQQLKDHAGDQTKFRHASTSAILAGLGLSGDQLRAVRTRLATVGAGGTVPGASSPAYASAGVVIAGDVHVHGVQDPRKFEEHMRKRARSRPVQRRGI